MSDTDHPNHPNNPKIVALTERYQALGHAVQTGVAYDTTSEAHMRDQLRANKHLRTGVNMRAVDNAALVDLLVEKGVFTRLEYAEKLVQFAENEVRSYEEKLKAAHGGKTEITLR